MMKDLGMRSLLQSCCLSLLDSFRYIYIEPNILLRICMYGSLVSLLAYSSSNQ